MTARKVPAPSGRRVSKAELLRMKAQLLSIGVALDVMSEATERLPELTLRQIREYSPALSEAVAQIARSTEILREFLITQKGK